MNEDVLSNVMNSLANVNIFDGEPGVLSEEIELKMNLALKSPKEYTKKVQNSMDRQVERILIDSGSFKNLISSNVVRVRDLIINYLTYENVVNCVVEEINGGVCSYDYARRVTDNIYLSFIREGILTNGLILGIPSKYWIELCESIFLTNYIGDIHSVMEKRSEILTFDRQKRVEKDSFNELIVDSSPSSYLFESEVAVNVFSKESEVLLREKIEDVSALYYLLFYKLESQLGQRLMIERGTNGVDEDKLMYAVDVYRNETKYSSALTGLNFDSSDVETILDGFISYQIGERIKLKAVKGVETLVLFDFLESIFDFTFNGNPKRLIENRLYK